MKKHIIYIVVLFLLSSCSIGFVDYDSPPYHSTQDDSCTWMKCDRIIHTKDIVPPHVVCGRPGVCEMVGKSYRFFIHYANDKNTLIECMVSKEWYERLDVGEVYNEPCWGTPEPYQE